MRPPPLSTRVGTDSRPSSWFASLAQRNPSNCLTARGRPDGPRIITTPPIPAPPSDDKRALDSGHGGHGRAEPTPSRGGQAGDPHRMAAFPPKPEHQRRDD